ncbi:hypothetical protein [Sphingopyxis kveilinensis]|uniref:hypothetical protein n=1 Tax=Sphingopyxis kveilinensis TaxID=3114367 RepID=UPI0030D20312
MKTNLANHLSLAEKNSRAAVAFLFGDLESNARACRVEFDAFRQADAIFLEPQAVTAA